MRAAQGKLFSTDGCGHEAQGAAAPPPGCTTAEGRIGRPPRKEILAGSASTQDGFAGALADAGKADIVTTRPRKTRLPLRAATRVNCGAEATCQGRLGVPVGGPSFVMHGRLASASRTARTRTTQRSKPQRAGTSPRVLRHRGGAQKYSPAMRAPIAVPRKTLARRPVAAWPKAATGRFLCGR